jgi:hypothetical protein
MSVVASLPSNYFGPQDAQNTGISRDAQTVSEAFETPGLEQAPSARADDLERIEQPMVAALIAAEQAGLAVKTACLVHALRFAHSLPTDWPPPDVVVEADGDIAFDWELGKRRVLTVAIAPDGRAGFSALIGHEPAYGKVLLGGAVPKTVAYLMDRMLIG